jgi:hypothetical protein
LKEIENADGNLEDFKFDKLFAIHSALPEQYIIHQREEKIQQQKQSIEEKKESRKRRKKICRKVEKNFH